MLRINYINIHQSGKSANLAIPTFHVPGDWWFTIRLIHCAFTLCDIGRCVLLCTSIQCINERSPNIPTFYSSCLYTDYILLTLFQVISLDLIANLYLSVLR